VLESEWQTCTKPDVMLRHMAERASTRKLYLFACACCRRLGPWLKSEASRQALDDLERQADAARPSPTPEATRALAEQGVHAAEQVRDALQPAVRERSAERSRTYEAIWGGEPPAPAVLIRTAAEAEMAVASRDEAAQGVRAAQLVLTQAEGTRPVRQVAADALQVVEAARVAAAVRARAGRWLLKAEEEAERPVPRHREAVRRSQAAAWVERQEELLHEQFHGRRTLRARAVERRAQCVLIRDIFDPFQPVVIDPAWRTWNGGCVVKMARAIYDERRFDDLPVLADALEEAGCTQRHLLGHCRGRGPHVRGCWALDALLGLA
jgi:hypothetical protein